MAMLEVVRVKCVRGRDGRGRIEDATDKGRRVYGTE